MGFDSLTDGLRFDEAAHVYTTANGRVPSVTQILNPLSERIYGKIPDEVLDRAADRGRTVHQAIELYLRTGVVDIPDEYAGYIEAFKGWAEAFKPVVHATEQPFYNKVFRYAGTVDLICEIGGEKVLVDFKTTAVLHEGIAGLQLEAYRRGIQSVVSVDKCLILQLKKDGTYTMRFLEENKAAERWQVFLSLLTIENYARKCVA